MNFRLPNLPLKVVYKLTSYPHLYDETGEKMLRAGRLSSQTIFVDPDTGKAVWKTKPLNFGRYGNAPLIRHDVEHFGTTIVADSDFSEAGPHVLNDLASRNNYYSSNISEASPKSQAGKAFAEGLKKQTKAWTGIFEKMKTIDNRLDTEVFSSGAVPQHPKKTTVFEAELTPEEFEKRKMWINNALKDSSFPHVKSFEDLLKTSKYDPDNP